jgi:hypothetical protein
MADGSVRDLGNGSRARRTDTLVSVVVVSPRGKHVSADVLAAVRELLAERFEFSELVVISASDEDPDTSDPSTSSVRRIRCEGRPSFDELAALGYAEAIGDVVVAASADELGLFGLETVLAPLLAGDDLVRVRRRRANLFGRIGSKLVEAVTGRIVDSRFYRTLGVSRTLLSTLASHPEQVAFLRFAETRAVAKQTVLVVDAPAPRGGLRYHAGRIDLTVRLVAEAAPRLLRFSAATCAVFAAGALALLLYVPLVWLFKAEVAEGWTSTTLLLAGWMFVQSAAMSAICLGAGRLLDRTGAKTRPWRVVSDLSTGRVFPAARILNVEGGHAPEGTAVR